MDRAPPFQLANNNALSLSSDFVLPEDRRPILSEVLTSASIPIIDLNDHDIDDGLAPSPLVSKISKACHGKVTMWSETFTHPWHPMDDFTHFLPTSIPEYRDEFTEYAREIGALTDRLLSLISQGLGLEKDCLKSKIGERPALYSQANYYPPCPNPELTMGLPDHNDLGALTLLLQSEGVTGLQAIKDGKWLAVDPVHNAFVVNLGDQIQVLSNGRYKSVDHRAITNDWLPRVSVAMFYSPNNETVIGPIEDLIDEDHPPMYRNYTYKEVMEEFRRQEGKRRRVKEAFAISMQR
ncbi:hypothetical protein SLA2020_367720 [Shorea laevis]